MPVVVGFSHLIKHPSRESTAGRKRVHMRSKRIPAAFAAATAVVLAVSACGSDNSSGGSDAGGDGSAPEAWAPLTVDVWDDLAMDSARSTAEYTPLEKAEKPWNLCVSFPHLKDAYWLGVGYGASEQAKAAGVNMTLVEAGGYENLD